MAFSAILPGRETCPVKLLVISDLHLDHRPAWEFPQKFPDYDVAICAGDINGAPAQGIRFLASAPGLSGKPVIFVAGNHEFYNQTLEDAIATGKAAARATDVRFLDADTTVIGGVRFVGATLWTDYNVMGNPAASIDLARRQMNDHRLIVTRSGGRPERFLPEHAIERHNRERAFLACELARAHAGPTVVVTHYAPHPCSIHRRFAGDLLTAAFVTDLSDLIERHRPEVWIHGHTHAGFDYAIGRTRVLANPKGYGPYRPGGEVENPTFDPHLVIEVSTP
jgi:Icc-related predicted phosphoesterase